jgi:hypothetical protein
MRRMLWILVIALSFGVAFAVDADFYVTKVSPTVLQPDSMAELNFTLKNLAPNYAAYTRVSLDPDDVSPIDPVVTSKKYVGKVREGTPSEQYFGVILQNEEVDVSYKVYVKPGTKEGVYYVPLLIEWKDEYLNPKSQTVNLAVLVKGNIDLGIANVITVPAEIRSGGKDVKLVVSITNTGESEARNLRAKLLLPEAFSPSSSGSTEAFLGTVQPSSMVNAEFQIDVAEKAEARRYSLPLELSYVDSAGEEHTERKEIEILVKPKPYFEVQRVSVEPESPSPGDSVLLKISVKNSGGEKAENTDIRVIREASQPFEFDVRSDYIGTLEPGDEGEAALKFTVKSDAIPKEYRLRLSIRCTGDSEAGDDSVYVQEVTVPVTVTASEASAASGYKEKAYLGIAAMAVILLAALWRKKK